MSTYKLSEHFWRFGHELGVFSFEAKGHIDQKFVLLFTAGEAKGAANPSNLRQLERVVREFRPDVVINQMPYEHAIGSVLRTLDPPLLLGCLRNTLFSVKNNLDGYRARVLPRGLAPLFRNPLGRWWLLHRHRARHRVDLERILATYDRFVMFAPPNLEELRFFVPDFDSDKIRLVPNSVPQVLTEVPEKEKRILWLGRVEYTQKRADLILPVWKRIRAALPDWELDVVGDGPALKDLQTEIATQGVQGVTLHGRQKPDEYFRRASVFLMTSAFEGFPNTVVEAQSFGAVPVLFNTFPVAEWLVGDGANGFLVPPFDVDAMAAKVVQIARDDGRQELMLGALENARRFEIERVVQIWERLFDQPQGAG